MPRFDFERAAARALLRERGLELLELRARAAKLALALAALAVLLVRDAPEDASPTTSGA